MISTENALVLAGGGVAGVAWETGFLLGLQDTDPALAARLLRPSTTLIGTSAGSVVAAQVAAGNDLQVLFDRQVALISTEAGAPIDFSQLIAVMTEALTGAASPEQMRQRLGALALATDRSSAPERRAVIEARLQQEHWPEWPLLVTTVDTATGEFRVFDNASGTNLVDVVGASCAVPGVWPPVAIDGRVYMDGGTRTIANADLAAGATQVLILVPSAEMSGFGPALPAAQLAELGEARIHVVYADEGSLAAIGANPLDPASRVPSAHAGREQGQRLAVEIANFWN